MAEPLLLIPGLMCTGDLFAPQMAAFEGQRRVHIADHTTAADMKTIARTILQNAPDRFALAGLSMGVYLSLEIMRLEPERVTRLALLDGKARPDTPEQTMARKALLAMADEGRYLDITKDILLSRLVAPDRVHEPDMRDTIIRMADDTGEAAFRRQMTAILTRPDYLVGLADIKCPTLVLTGGLDVITPPDCAEEMAALIPGAQLEILKGCGHLSTLEAPNTVNTLLQGWLNA